MTTRKLRTATLVSSSLLLLATAHARPAKQQPGSPFKNAKGSSVAPFMAPAEASDSTVVLAPDSASNTAAAKAPEVPINAAALKFVQAYIKKNNESLTEIEQRSAGAFRIIEPILERYDLPVELKYLAVVESDLKRTAVSHVGAAGPWQLMPTTARELGLRVSKKHDERKMYVPSTTAAAKYLRDLYRYYGDWLLVIAAYNAGPGVVNKAIKRAGSRNFWRLQAFLPAETRGHVKRFIGTHYFFEDGGSETTLTKAEAAVHAKAMQQFLDAAAEANATDNTTENNTAEPAPPQAILIETALRAKDK